MSDPARDPIEVLRDALQDKITASWARDSSAALAALSRLEALRDAARTVVRHDHIGECGDHPEHLMAAENDICALRAALAACDNETSRT
jgi:hypothetical protein